LQDPKTCHYQRRSGQGMPTGSASIDELKSRAMTLDQFLEMFTL
jgi:hypothetical protein